MFSHPLLHLSLSRLLSPPSLPTHSPLTSTPSPSLSPFSGSSFVNVEDGHCGLALWTGRHPAETWPQL